MRVTTGFEARHKKVATNAVHSCQLYEDSQQHDAAHQLHQTCQRRAIVVSRNPDSLFQTDFLPQQDPDNRSRRHNADPAYLKQQREQDNSPLIKHVMDPDYGKTSHTDRAGCSEHRIDKRQRNTGVVKNRQPEQQRRNQHAAYVKQHNGNPMTS